MREYKTIKELRKELDELPGGMPCVIIGIAFAFLIAFLSMLSIVSGICCVILTGLILFLYTKGLVISMETVTVLCSALAALPFILCLFFLFWAIVSLISVIALAFI